MVNHQGIGHSKGWNMKPHRIVRFVLLLLCLAVLTPVWSGPPRQGEPIRPVPLQHDQPPAKVSLGERLFHDPRLSANSTLSCATCHPLHLGGMDRKAQSPGVAGQLGGINTPTVYNSGLNSSQFWDGRALNLAAQVDGPLLNPLEMAASWPQVLARLSTDPAYVEAFQTLYPDAISAASVRDAIAAFEESLLTTQSRFDRWLNGDENALSEQQLRGYALFKSYGCSACHQGAGIGGNMYHRMGLMGDYFAFRGGSISKHDLGRYNVTGDERDKHWFKVPSLRLAVLTPPYFHDGHAITLEEAIQTMARFQLGRPIPERDIADIIAFLHSVVGQHPALRP